MEQPSITTDNYRKFKNAYVVAAKTGKKEFEFEGARVLLSYAKYVIDYFDKAKL